MCVSALSMKPSAAKHCASPQVRLPKRTKTIKVSGNGRIRAHTHTSRAAPRGDRRKGKASRIIANWACAIQRMSAPAQPFEVAQSRQRHSPFEPFMCF